MTKMIRLSGPMPGRRMRLGLAAAGLALLAGCQNGTGFQMPQFTFPDLRGTLPYDPMGVGGGGAAPAATGGGLVTDGFAGQAAQTAAPVAPAVPVAPAAPVAPGVTAPAVAATPATTHTVVAGETAYSVARRYGVTVQQLAVANGLAESMTIRTGQRLTIPAGSAVATLETAPGVGSPTPVPPSASKPLPTKTPPAAATPVDKPANDLGKTRTAASSSRLQMSSSGSITRAYKKGVNDGIDIAAPAGSSVKAAASGTVAAITKDTDQVPIIVVRHADGLMTVYANVEGVTVKKGESVKKGQTIGKARSGPLHFEVRQGFDSVNPSDYL